MHSDLARVLVEDGFVVAMPEHRGDNYKDRSSPGPASWVRRPAEVSRAIDVVGQDARFRPLLALDKVGMYGMSAGGHTGLSLAGGRWSPAVLRRHCGAHIAEDFQSCVGLTTSLNGGIVDGPKKTIALWVIRWRLKDATWHTHADPRIAAVVAGVPFAADFDMTSLAVPHVPLGMVTARQDKWLIPRFHSDAVLQACTICERLADLAKGGHGADIFSVHPELPNMIVDWYVTTLIKSPGRAPVSKDNPAVPKELQVLDLLDQPGGVTKVAHMLEDARRSDPKAVIFPEAPVNLMGYELLQANNTKGAIDIFKLNAVAYPNSANVYDSLSDALLADGQKDLARQNAKKALELLPADSTLDDQRRNGIKTSAEQKLKQLGDAP